MSTPASIEGQSWTDALTPTTHPMRERLSEYSDAQAWHLEVQLQPWALLSGQQPPSRSDTYGWKPQVQSEFSTPLRSTGEVELAQRMRAADYTSYWIDSWGAAPSIWRTWARRTNELPRAITDLDRAIRQHPLMHPWKKGGMPDVVAIEQATDRVLFIEYKGPSAANPRKQDKINEKQDCWYRAALDTGVLNESSYVVAKWIPDDKAKALLQAQLQWRKTTFQSPAV